VELYLLCPICLPACTWRTLPTYTTPAFTQGHVASHPSDMACARTKSTHQLHTSTAPRHASHGWKSSQTVNDPAMSGEANRSIYAGWRTKPWRTFILHVVTWTNLWNSSSPKFGFQTTLRLVYVLHVSRQGHQDEKHELKQPISKHKLLLRKLWGVILDYVHTTKSNILYIVNKVRVWYQRRTY